MLLRPNTVAIKRTAQAVERREKVAPFEGRAAGPEMKTATAARVGIGLLKSLPASVLARPALGCALSSWSTGIRDQPLGTQARSSHAVVPQRFSVTISLARPPEAGRSGAAPCEPLRDHLARSTLDAAKLVSARREHGVEVRAVRCGTRSRSASLCSVWG